MAKLHLDFCLICFNLELDFSPPFSLLLYG
jgi:hypothetical protein